MTTNKSENNPETTETDSDWISRKLCIDESCIGTIGKDGRCRACGLMENSDTENDSPSQEPVAFEEDTKDTEDSLTFSEDAEDAEDAENADTVPEEEDTTEEAPGWEDRKLCIDESCIGTIGKNGRCNICGLPEKTR